MSTSGEGSVTRWLGDLKSGGDASAQHLWERCFDRLVNLARRSSAPAPAPPRTRRTRRSAASTASAAARPRAGIPGSTTAMTCGGCWW